jgi:hypothetical protein
MLGMKKLILSLFGIDPLEEYLKSIKQEASDSGIIQKKIQDLKVGESGWTVPWAIGLDESHKPWINGKYTIHSDSGGTIQAFISRNETGFYASIPKDEGIDVEINYKFGPGGWYTIPLVEVTTRP